MRLMPYLVIAVTSSTLFLAGCASPSTSATGSTSSTLGQASDGQACQMWIQSYKDFIFAYTAAEKTAQDFKADPNKFSYVDETGATVTGDFDPFEQAKVSYSALSTTLADDAEPLIKETGLKKSFETFVGEYSKPFSDFTLDEKASDDLETACKNLGVDTFEVQKAKRDAR